MLETIASTIQNNSINNALKMPALPAQIAPIWLTVAHAMQSSVLIDVPVTRNKSVRPGPGPVRSGPVRSAAARPGARGGGAAEPGRGAARPADGPFRSAPARSAAPRRGAARGGGGGGAVADATPPPRRPRFRNRPGRAGPDMPRPAHTQEELETVCARARRPGGRAGTACVPARRPSLRATCAWAAPARDPRGTRTGQTPRARCQRAGPARARLCDLRAGRARAARDPRGSRTGRPPWAPRARCPRAVSA